MKLIIELNTEDIKKATNENVELIMNALHSIAGEDKEEVAEEKPKKKRKHKTEEPVEAKQEEVKTEEVKQEETKTKEPAEPKQEEAKTEEPAEAKQEEPAKEIPTLDAIKARVMEIREQDRPKWDGIKKLIDKYGNGKISAIPEKQRAVFMAEVEAL